MARRTKNGGIAAASICIFPSDSSEWEDPAATIKMYARGSATSELVGMAFSVNTLLQNPAKFETAVCIRTMLRVYPTSGTRQELVPSLLVMMDGSCIL